MNILGYIPSYSSVYAAPPPPYSYTGVFLRVFGSESAVDYENNIILHVFFNILDIFICTILRKTLFFIKF